MKLLAIASTVALAAWAAAQDLGTKADPVSTSAKYDAGSPGLMPILQTIVVLGIVLFALKTAAPKILAKWNKRIVAKTGGQIRIEESATFAGGSLYVVEARGKTLLLSVGANGVSCLSELNSPAPASEPPLFMEIVEQESARQGDDPAPPQAAVYLEDEEPEVPAGEAAQTLSLLRNEEVEALRRAHRLNA